MYLGKIAAILIAHTVLYNGFGPGTVQVQAMAQGPGTNLVSHGFHPPTARPLPVMLTLNNQHIYKYPDCLFCLTFLAIREK